MGAGVAGESRVTPECEVQRSWHVGCLTGKRVEEPHLESKHGDAGEESSAQLWVEGGRRKCCWRGATHSRPSRVRVSRRTCLGGPAA
eukprot:scaffold1197_cov121-Isochrysis_galbana.AAC.4